MAAPAALPAASLHRDAVQAIRRFNRFYTRQIGVLQEHLLESQFSLTEVRVLYELAHREHSTAAELCDDLGLDRGYLSRMLQGFEKQKLIETTPSSDDRRRIFLSMTAKGRKTLAPLERRSSQEVGAILGKISPARQKNLLAAMREIEVVLTPSRRSAAPYILRRHRPGDMGWVVHRHGVLYSQEYGYDERFEALVAEIVAHFVAHFDGKRDACWMAKREGEIVGSIFLVGKSKSVAKLRLLLVEPSTRGLGIGKRLVSECVRFARQAGYKKIVLWTQSELLAARHLYQQAGFKLAGKKRHDSWSRKGLVAETWELKL
jgi:DNA-binding MarR family transcriptional regulator/N-acetylglutamate synthase-like GNAT family acetyltransferase